MFYKSIYIALLIIIASVTIYIKYIPGNSNNTTPSKKTQLSDAHHTPTQASLSFSPDTLYAKINNEYETNINIEAEGFTPNLAQIELSYDPDIITIVSITPGTLFANPETLIDDIDTQYGRISYAIKGKAIENKKNEYKNKTVAKLKFKTTPQFSQGITTINFLPKTAIRSASQNIYLQNLSGLTIFINSQTSLFPSIAPTL